MLKTLNLIILTFLSKPPRPDTPPLNSEEIASGYSTSLCSIFYTRGFFYQVAAPIQQSTRKKESVDSLLLQTMNMKLNLQSTTACKFDIGESSKR